MQWCLVSFFPRLPSTFFQQSLRFKKKICPIKFSTDTRLVFLCAFLKKTETFNNFDFVKKNCKFSCDRRDATRETRVATQISECKKNKDTATKWQPSSGLWHRLSLKTLSLPSKSQQTSFSEKTFSSESRRYTFRAQVYLRRNHFEELCRQRCLHSHWSSKHC